MAVGSVPSLVSSGTSAASFHAGSGTLAVALEDEDLDAESFVELPSLLEFLLPVSVFELVVCWSREDVCCACCDCWFVCAGLDVQRVMPNIRRPTRSRQTTPAMMGARGYCLMSARSCVLASRCWVVGRRFVRCGAWALRGLVRVCAEPLDWPERAGLPCERVLDAGRGCDGRLALLGRPELAGRPDCERAACPCGLRRCCALEACCVEEPWAGRRPCWVLALPDPWGGRRLLRGACELLSVVFSLC